MPKFAFKNGIVPFKDAKIHIASPWANYALAVFGGMRGYWTSEYEELFLFRPVDHFRRLLGAAKILKISIPYGVSDLIEITKELLRAEAYRQDCYIRPQVGKDCRENTFFVNGELVTEINVDIGPKLEYPTEAIEDVFAMFAIPFGDYHKENRLRIVTSSWRRIRDDMIPQNKLIGLYENSAFAKDEAKRAGCDDAVMLNAEGNVAEMSAANIFVVNDGQLITPPPAASILKGITRKTMFFLAETKGIKVVERDVSRTELYMADEVFACGTGYKVAPIVEIDGVQIGDGLVGPITAEMRDIYLQLVHARTRYVTGPAAEWLVPVYGTDKVR